MADVSLDLRAHLWIMSREKVCSALLLDARFGVRFLLGSPDTFDLVFDQDQLLWPISNQD